MRTTDLTLDRTLTGVQSTPSRKTGLMGVLKSVLLQFRNRQAIGSLNDLDDHQLLDMGLSRHEVREALTSAFFDDPGRHLTQAARHRTNTFYRNARRD
ncbi:DUF1127 domain-containing protein [Pararhizobium antarcticum]|uniref:YjiS-like domain-containing protein n=1 Tax=Pararhizobium antarcticum TaxID=1798805 RepID=A0A657LXA4_9HYPH|nr:DUF1127 domain-containing protein [Pararhizobium antarcticum]OJF90346.1 hypothetical protein AX761_06650 [Rhizobium sp. 58]OJG00592.1 hypothetical protein AX760_10540 [Pararhizobium antarcticum]